MVYKFEPWQLNELQSRLDIAETTHNYAPVYDYIFWSISNNAGTGNETPKANVDKSVWLWIRGARQTNADDGSYFSDFIRDYTNEQHKLREGVGTAQIDAASDDIARRVAQDILNAVPLSPNLNPNNELPPLSRIGINDAGSIASGIFGKNYSPWAGTILFPFLGEGSFTRDWLLTNEKSDFKKLSGTYDLVSVAATAHSITNLWEGLWNSGKITDTVNSNSIGRDATLALLASLRLEANSFFQKSYAVSDIGQFQIGGDLPLYGDKSFTSAAEYAFHPTYILGLLGNDAGIQMTADNDIVHAGTGNDVIRGSMTAAGTIDLVDGGEGIDTFDWSGFVPPINVVQGNVDGTLYKDRFVITNSQTVSTTYAYGIEKIIGTSGNDTFTIKPNAGLIIDGGGGTADKVILGKSHALKHGDVIYVTDAIKQHHADKPVILNAEKIEVQSGQSGFFVVEKMGNSYVTPSSSGYFPSPPDYYTTLSYKNYNRGVTFNLASKTISDGQNVDTFTGAVGIIGTDHGDTYTGASFRFPVFSGKGNDLFDYAVNPQIQNTRVMYGGGDDIVMPVGYNSSSVVLVFPFGVKLSDITFDVLNIRTTETDLTIETVADLKVYIRNYGSIFYHDRIESSHQKSLKPGEGPLWTVGANIGVISTEEGMKYVFVSSAPSTNPVGIPPLSVKIGYGAGNDTAYDGTAYHGTLAADTINLNNYYAYSNFYGYDGNDTIIGSSQVNIVYGGGGDDTFTGNGGDDVFYGGAGSDTAIFSNSYASYVIYNTEYVTITSVSGTASSVKLYDVEAIKFSDTIVLYQDGKFSSPSPVTIYNPGTGNDSINASTAIVGVTINLLAGNDTFTGSNFNDIVNAGEGDDLVEGAGGNDTLIGGQGIDTITYSGSMAAVTVNLATTVAQNTVGAGTDTISGFENLTGSNYNDTLTGDAANNRIEGLAGNDIMNGGAGTDVLAYASSAAAVTVNLSLTSAQNTIGAGTDTISGFENLVGSAFNDTLTGDANVNVISGGYGDDTIDGHGGDDDLRGENGIDTVSYVSAASYVWVDLAKTTRQDTVGAGRDLISGFENLTGSSYGDWLGGDANANTINGGAGMDTLDGRAGDDTLNGNTGDDYIIGGSGSDVLYGGDGNDTLMGHEYPDVPNDGLPDNDILEGGKGWDVMDGIWGDDTFVFRMGDSLIGNPDFITENLNQGIDTIKLTGGILPQNVTLVKNANEAWYRLKIGTTDEIRLLAYAPGGSMPIDQLNFEKLAFDNGTVLNLADLLSATPTYIPTTGNDTLNASAASAGVTINLLAGNDIFTGSNYNDNVSGGDGNDTIEGKGGNDILKGDAGTDTVSYASATAAVTVNLATTAAQNTVGAGTDTISGFENLTGSAFNDTLTGNSGANVIDGGAGNDTIQGGAGNDVLIGGAGTDRVTFAAATAAVTVNLATTAAQNTVGAGTDTISGFENLTGSNYNDTLTGDAGANVIDGGSGNDIIQGGAGNDTLIGGAGTDTVTYASATAGVTVNLGTTAAQNTVGAGTDTISTFENLTGSSYNDVLTGSSGNNTIKGGAGNDIIQGGAGNDILNGETGTDTVTYAAATAAVTVNLATTTSQATGGAGSDTITNFENLTGSSYSDTLRGNTGNNTLTGGNGNDKLYGNSGNDILYGDAGTDTLYGDAGNDTLNGGASNDILYGGTGSDIFKFSPGGGIDTVKDFKKTEVDKLDIKDLLTGYDPATKAITDFIQITTSGTSSIVKIDANGLTGGTAWTQIATLENITGLTDEAALKAAGTIIA